MALHAGAIWAVYYYLDVYGDKVLKVCQSMQWSLKNQVNIRKHMQNVQKV